MYHQDRVSHHTFEESVIRVLRGIQIRYNDRNVIYLFWLVFSRSSAYAAWHHLKRTTWSAYTPGTFCDPKAEVSVNKSHIKERPQLHCRLRHAVESILLPSLENFDDWNEVVDVTLLIINEIFKMENWRVSDLRSFSYYSWILLNRSRCRSLPPFQRPQEDWLEFRQFIKNQFSGVQIGNIGMIGELQSKAGTLGKAFEMALKG